MKKVTRRRLNRKGIEAVETALTLPLLLVAMFSGIQIAHKLHIQTVLKMAAAEAMVAGARDGGTQAEANRVFQEHCRALGLRDCQLLGVEDMDSINGANKELWVRPVASSASNKLPLPLSASFSGDWIYGGDIYYRRESLND